MVIAVYGGSFDPPHVGHVLAAHYVLSVGLADRVFVIPVFQHALDKQLSDFHLRLQMCRMAFSSDERITVSDVERTLPKPSFTLTTLERLRELFPGDELRLLVGADVLPEAPRWHRFAEVKKLAPLIVLGRAGVESEEAPEAVLPAVSSTEARSWWRKAAPVEARRKRERLIPSRVRELIEAEGLYRD